MDDKQLPETPVDSGSTVPPTLSPTPSAPAEIVHTAPKSRKGFYVVICLVVLIATTSVTIWLLHKHSTKPQITLNIPAAQSSQKTTSKTSDTSQVQGLQLDTKKNYGNKYANGLLPVGDGKYSTTAAKQGYVFACSTYAQNLSSSQGGAGTRGPWFTNNNTEYDINKKAHVAGSVPWQGSFKDNLSGSNRIITGNDLPNHPTGVFPIAASDPAYAYDRNPNSIKSQSLSYTLAANPTYGTANCVGGEVGVMLTGVALFNGFDAGGRDAGAWEVQDNCGGHPQVSGEYHYHTLSSCITDTSVLTVIGFALDGFPITGPKVGTNNMLTTSDLDECHGIVSQVNLDGKPVTTYHYVMTQDFPYSVSCFRSMPTQTTPAASGQDAKPISQPNAPPLH
jgi:hypothetical protein